MDSGLYAACAGLMARTEQLDTIASNLANAGSAGFKGQKNVFGSVLAEAARHGTISNLNRTTNSYGVLSGTELDSTQGALVKTDNPLDIALVGPGYFKVQTSHGPAYSRDGNLQVSPKGQLTTAAGDPVLGESGPIVLSKGAVTISDDGTIASDGAIVGKLKVVTFSPGTVPDSRGSGYYAAPPGSEQPAPNTEIRQGALENSNVSSVSGVVELISAQRSAETMRRVLSLLDSEMDKTAAQELPKA